MGKSLSEAERLDWLRLIRSENVGPITFFESLRHYGSAAEALAALPELSRRGGRRKALRWRANRDARYSPFPALRSTHDVAAPTT